MAYGPETHTGYLTYEILLEHVPTAVRLGIYVNPHKADGSVPSEASRDQIVQTFLNKLSELPNTTVVSATKKGEFNASITPA